MKYFESTSGYDKRIFKAHDGKEYGYYRATLYHKDEEISNDPKRIYVISFPENAPEGLETNTPYILKKGKNLDAGRLTSKFPRDRTVWDFLDYNGDHLRRILAKNADAHRLQVELTNYGVENLNFPYSCETIEPYYQSLTTKEEGYLLKEVLNGFSDIQKIDCLIQVATAVKELRSDANRIKIKNDQYSRIIIHRDLKFSNVVYSEQNGKLKFVLIDFPSIKCLPTDNSRVTSSPNNTSPELLIDKLLIDERSDVFALAMMMAEIFEIYEGHTKFSNPLSIFFREHFVEKYGKENAKTASGDSESYKMVYESVYNKLLAEDRLSSSGWLDEYLKTKNIRIKWPRQLKHIFYRSICFDPSCRMTLDEFIQQLTKVKNYLEQTPDGITYSIFAFDTTRLDPQTKEVYLREAQKIYNNLSDRTSCAAVVSFGEESDHTKNHCQMPLTSATVDAESLCDSFDKIRDEVKGYTNTAEGEFSLLSVVLQQARKLLKGNSETDVRFSGNVYIFTPIAPAPSRFAVFLNENHKQILFRDIVDGLNIHIYHGGFEAYANWFYSHPVSDIDRQQGNGMFVYDTKNNRYVPV